MSTIRRMAVLVVATAAPAVYITVETAGKGSP